MAKKLMLRCLLVTAVALFWVAIFTAVSRRATICVQGHTEPRWFGTALVCERWSR